MRAVVITRPGAPDVLSISEVGEPRPSSQQVLVRVRAAGLNRADLLQRRGLYPPPAGVRDDIPGLEFAGTLVETGSSVRGFEVGDRVMGLVEGAAQAEFVVSPPELLIRLPETMDFVEAAAVPEVFLTAHDALHNRLHLKSGETLLVHAAASGVGTTAIQLARVLGAVVYGTTSSPEKMKAIRDLGVAVPINYREEDFSERVLEETGGIGVNALLDLVGASHLAGNLKCLAPRGRVVVVGLVGGSRTEIDLAIVLRKRLEIVGTVLRSRSFAEKAELVRDFMTTTWPLLAQGRIHPIVDSTFPLEKVSAAHEYMEMNRNIGKVVLEIP